MTSSTLSTQWDRKHLLALDGLSAADLHDLLERAESLTPVVHGDMTPPDLLQGRIIGNMFLEDSTRTRCSFTVAVQRLGGSVVDLSESGSSRSKGETLIDTAVTVESMGVDGLVVRTSLSGGAALVARHVGCPVINAGDGRHEHPTQGLLDMLTLRERLGELAGKRIAIVGDIANSRVARSNLWGLTAMGVDVVLVGPPHLVPASFEQIFAQQEDDRGSVEVCHHLDQILGEIDAIMMLRVQFERGSRIPPDIGPTLV